MVDPAVRRLGEKLTGLETQIRRISTQPQLANSSIEDGSTDAYDADGTLVNVFGKQFDGTHIAASLAGPIPPATVAPTLTGGPTGVTVQWSGEWVDGALAPMDLSRIDVAVFSNAATDPLTVRPAASIVSQGWGGASVNLPDGTYYAALIARTQSGKFAVSEVSNAADVFLPPAEPPTPVAPESSPTPTADGFAGLVLLRWVGILNESSVTYDVHVAASNASAPSPSTLVDSVQSTSASVRTLASGVALDYDADYYFAVWARSDDQYAPAPSAWVLARMDKLRNADLAADAIDGMTITGATVRTASAGAREQITTADGYQSFNAAGEVQTQIKDGKLTARDGEFSGTVTGSAIAGGAIAIAQGTASTTSQDFTSASGATAPTGWTRTVAASTGTGGGVDFPTGGNPGRYLRLRSGTVTSGQDRREIAYPAAVSGQDFDVRLDYRWSGDDPVVDFANDHYLNLRATGADLSAANAGAVRVSLLSGYVQIRDGSTTVGRLPLPRVAINTWVQFRFVLRGTALTAYLTSGGVTQSVSIALSSAPVTGAVGFVASTTGFFGAASFDRQVHVDNVTIDVLQTGFRVAPDGKTEVERLIVNQSVSVPDPFMPTDGVNLRTLNARTDGETDITWIDLPLRSAFKSQGTSFEPQIARHRGVIYLRGAITPRSGGFAALTEYDVADLPPGFTMPSGDYWTGSGSSTTAIPTIKLNSIGSGANILRITGGASGTAPYCFISHSWLDQ